MVTKKKYPNIDFIWPTYRLINFKCYFAEFIITGAKKIEDGINIRKMY